MAAETSFGTCLLGVMDRLWFQQIILFSPSPLLLSNSISKTLDHEQSSHELNYATESNSNACFSEAKLPQLEDLSSASSLEIITPPQDDETDDEKEDNVWNGKCPSNDERPTRLNLLASKSRSHSSSPCVHKKRTSVCGGSSPQIRGYLQKTMSCKSLSDLELEEVKGFMDLGFVFTKEHLSKRMMSVLPGLQRLEAHKNLKYFMTTHDDDDDDEEEEEEEEEEEMKRGIIRPYLSEAWLIKRPDSPLLNLRIPKVSAAADMKKHLRYWARTVATAIQQES